MMEGSQPDDFAQVQAVHWQQVQRGRASEESAAAAEGAPAVAALGVAASVRAVGREAWVEAAAAVASVVDTSAARQAAVVAPAVEEGAAAACGYCSDFHCWDIERAEVAAEIVASS